MMKINFDKPSIDTGNFAFSDKKGLVLRHFYDIKSMTDDELQTLVASFPPNPKLDAWVKGLSSEQLELVASGAMHYEN